MQSIKKAGRFTYHCVYNVRQNYYCVQHMLYNPQTVDFAHIMFFFVCVFRIILRIKNYYFHTEDEAWGYFLLCMACIFNVILQHPVALHRCDSAFCFMPSVCNVLYHSLVVSIKKNDEWIVTEVAHWRHKSKTQSQVYLQYWSNLVGFCMIKLYTAGLLIYLTIVLNMLSIGTVVLYPVGW
jgi:small-conductance mechanosensitive channel